MINFDKEETIELIPSVKDWLKYVDRIMDTNERLLKIIEQLGSVPMLVKINPERRDVEDG